MTRIKGTKQERAALGLVYAAVVVRRLAERQQARAWYAASMRKVRRALRNERLGVL